MRIKVGGEVDDDDGSDLTAWEWEVKKALSFTWKEATVQSKGGKPPKVDYCSVP